MNTDLPFASCGARENGVNATSSSAFGRFGGGSKAVADAVRLLDIGFVVHTLYV